MQIIYLIVGVVAYEGEIVLFAFKDIDSAQKKLNELESSNDKDIYCRYEINQIELK